MPQQPGAVCTAARLGRLGPCTPMPSDLPCPPCPCSPLQCVPNNACTTGWLTTPKTENCVSCQTAANTPSVPEPNPLICAQCSTNYTLNDVGQARKGAWKPEALPAASACSLPDPGGADAPCEALLCWPAGPACAAPPLPCRGPRLALLSPLGSAARVLAVQLQLASLCTTLAPFARACSAWRTPLCRQTPTASPTPSRAVQVGAALAHVGLRSCTPPHPSLPPLHASGRRRCSDRRCLTKRPLLPCLLCRLQPPPPDMVRHLPQLHLGCGPEDRRLPPQVVPGGVGRCAKGGAWHAAGSVRGLAGGWANGTFCSTTATHDALNAGGCKRCDGQCVCLECKHGHYVSAGCLLLWGIEEGA